MPTAGVTRRRIVRERTQNPQPRILIGNASGQVMPKSYANAFPAHGNHYGKTAGVKIDLAFDLLTGSIVGKQGQHWCWRE